MLNILQYTFIITMLTLVASIPTNLLRAVDCKAVYGIPGAAYHCPQANFQPSDTEKCNWIKPETCVSYSGKAHTAMSLGPDPGGYCVLFHEENCQGEYWDPITGTPNSKA
jgi:hypothetical protein